MEKNIVIFNYENDDEIVLNNRTRLRMPNGDIFLIKWNHVEEGMEVTKELSDGGESLSIFPKVSNQILIK